MAANPSELVTIRNPYTLQERSVQRGSLPFFVNQGFEVLTPKGNVSESATVAAKQKGV